MQVGLKATSSAVTNKQTVHSAACTSNKHKMCEVNPKPVTREEQAKQLIQPHRPDQGPF